MRTRGLLLLFLLAAPLAIRAANGVPTPESVFGFVPGADYKLATYDQSVDYFKKLAAASKYMKLVEAGKTSQGRHHVLRAGLVAGQPRQDRSVSRDRAASRASAGPDRSRGAHASRAKARRSSTSTAACTRPKSPAGQHTPQLLYDLVNRANEPDVKAILDNVVLMLWPTINPDGQQMVAEWYMQNVGTPYELSGLPRLYQEYVGHDNNRDAYMLNMIESRVLEHTWRQWEPQIIYVHHQSGPFPDAHLAAAVLRTGRHRRAVPHVARSEHDRHGDRERPRRARPGRRDAHGHGVRRLVSRATSTTRRTSRTSPRSGPRPRSIQYATPHEYTIDDFPQNMRDLRPQSLYSSPWPPGWWRLRDAVDYMETASLSVLEFAVEVQGLAAAQSLPARARSDRARQEEGAVRLLHPAAAARSGRRRRTAAAPRVRRRARLPADGRRHDRRRHLPGRHLGRSPPIRNSRRWRARCSTCSSIRTCGSIRAVRRSVRTTPPAGRCRCRWAFASWSTRRAAGRRDAANMKLVGAIAGSEGQADAVRSGAEEPTRRRSTACPALGFDTDPAAAAIAAAGRPRHRIRPDPPGRSGAEQRLSRDQSRVGAGRHRSGERGIASPLRDHAASPTTRRTISSSRSRCRRSARMPHPAAPIRKPRIGLYQPWTGSMDEGWTRWVLEQYGFAFAAIHPEDFKSPLARQDRRADHRRRCARADRGRAAGTRPRRPRRAGGASGPSTRIS